MVRFHAGLLINITCKTMLRKITKLVNTLKYVFKWLIIVWKDKPYDYNFLWILLQYKLKTMREFFGSSNTLSKYASRNIPVIKDCEYLLTRLIKDDYHELAGDYLYEQKWGKSKVIITPVKDRHDLFELQIIEKNAATIELQKQARKEWNVISKNAEYLKKQDIKYLFHLISKHILNWWD